MSDSESSDVDQAEFDAWYREWMQRRQGGRAAAATPLPKAELVDSTQQQDTDSDSASDLEVTIPHHKLRKSRGFASLSQLGEVSDDDDEAFEDLSDLSDVEGLDDSDSDVKSIVERVLKEQGHTDFTLLTESESKRQGKPSQRNSKSNRKH